MQGSRSFAPNLPGRMQDVLMQEVLMQEVLMQEVLMQEVLLRANCGAVPRGRARPDNE